MFVLHFYVEEWIFASTKVHTWYCLRNIPLPFSQIKADWKRWWENTILSLSLRESTAWSICHWGEKDEEDDEIDRRYRPACNFSYFHAFQDPLWLDGMQDRFYLTLIQAVPHSERKAYILVWGCGLNLFFRVFLKPCSTSYLAVRGWGTCCWLQD